MPWKLPLLQPMQQFSEHWKIITPKSINRCLFRVASGIRLKCYITDIAVAVAISGISMLSNGSENCICHSERDVTQWPNCMNFLRNTNMAMCSLRWEMQNDRQCGLRPAWGSVVNLCSVCPGRTLGHGVCLYWLACQRVAVSCLAAVCPVAWMTTTSCLWSRTLACVGSRRPWGGDGGVAIMWEEQLANLSWPFIYLFVLFQIVAV